jgi:Neprosin
MIRNPNAKAGAPGEAPPPTHEEIVRHFERRRSALEVVKTTRTPSGQLLDWIPRESQAPQGAIASPPPLTEAPEPGPGRGLEFARFELDDLRVERGPQGTVPVVRKDFSRIHATDSLARYLGKRGGLYADPEHRPADPTPFGYFHARSTETVHCYGSEGWLNVWAPWVETSDDHSIMQTGLQNRDNGTLQSLEAGWGVSHQQYGDWQPHLFTYYTTNGYSGDGDDAGGYNTDVAGWVQYDRSVFPGALISGASAEDATQLGISIKYQLWQGNWWFQTQGIWLGYYPATLFSSVDPAHPALGDRANWLGFWGEVYSADADPTRTVSEMGSGRFAEEGWTRACFQSNLRVQTAPDGSMQDHSGSTSGEKSAFYDIDAHMSSGSSWGSYFYAGGPGNPDLQLVREVEQLLDEIAAGG